MYKAKVLLKFIFFQNLAAHIIYAIAGDLILGVIGRKIIGHTESIKTMLTKDFDEVMTTILAGILTAIVVTVILAVTVAFIDKIKRQWRKVKRNS